MRTLLSRDRNNEFFIPDSFLYKNKVRIVGVYENESILKPEEYEFMGPRRIKMNRFVEPTSKIYGKIVEVRLGNKLIGR